MIETENRTVLAMHNDEILVKTGGGTLIAIDSLGRLDYPLCTDTELKFRRPTWFSEEFKKLATAAVRALGDVI